MGIGKISENQCLYLSRELHSAEIPSGVLERNGPPGRAAISASAAVQQERAPGVARPSDFSNPKFKLQTPNF